MSAGSMHGDEPLRLHLDQVLDEVQPRVNAIRGTRDRVRTLLEAVLAVGRGLELPQVLRQVVEAAVALGRHPMGSAPSKSRQPTAAPSHTLVIRPVPLLSRPPEERSAAQESV